jgi:cyclic beta-1,2-glucan synthetase
MDLAKSRSMIIEASAPSLAPPYRSPRLEQLARELADAHRVPSGRRRGRPILPRLLANRRSLQHSARVLAADARRGEPSSPAAEWLLDNFQLVEDQLREIETDMPPGYYSELPKLADGASAGLPRVFAIAQAFVDHTDRRFDEGALRCFLVAYQAAQPLTLGELWAVPISIRVILIEALRTDVDVVLARRFERASADAIADALLSATRARWVARRLRRLARFEPAPAFSARLFQRLHDRDPDTSLGLVWLRV